MPDFIRHALESHVLWVAYNERPPCQQNDYLGWITRAMQGVTKQKRLNLMLNELEQGDSYMKMKWRARK